jgi:hypothetical protein
MTSDVRETIEHEIGTQGTVSIRGFDASIELRAVDGSLVRVRGDGSRPLEEDYRVRRGAGELELSATGLSAFGFRWLVGRRCQPIQVDVPRGVEVRVEAASGSIRADGLVGRQRYRSMSGDISLLDSGGSLDLETVSGLVRIRAVGELRVEARTVSGDLDLDAPAIATLQARTTSGSLRLAGSFSGAGPYAVETVSGDVTIAPLGALRVEGTTVSGDVRSSLPHRSGGRPGRRSIELGEGGPLIGFRSISGDLEIAAGRSSGTAPEPTGGPADSTAPDPTDGLRLAILRELESGSIDVAEADRRLTDIDDRAARPSIDLPPTARVSGPAADLGWVRRV